MATPVVPLGEGLALWSPKSELRPIWQNVPERTLKIMLDPVAFFEVFCRYEGRPYEFWQWQREFLRRKHRFRAMEKSRQIGYSFICAVEALHTAFFYMDEDSVFVSLTEKDAINKVLFARKIYEGIPEQFRKYVPLASETKAGLWLGRKERPARIESRAASGTLRGLSGHVYLDEIDLFREGDDKEVFTAALPVTTRGFRLTMGSSVYGEDTQLSKVVRKEDGRFKDFLSFSIPWVVIEDADLRESILSIRDNMDLEDFEQEYECVRGGNVGATFSQNLIRASWSNLDNHDVERLDPDGTFMTGFDPGGDRHPHAMCIIRKCYGGWEMVTMDASRDETLGEQENRLSQLLAKFPNMSLALDQGGVGHQMSQTLQKKWGTRRVKAVNFSTTTKPLMISDMKRLMEDGSLTILRDPELARELNKTKLLPGGKVVQAGEVRRTHFDRCWAACLAASLIAHKSESVYKRRGIRVLDMSDDDGLEMAR